MTSWETQCLKRQTSILPHAVPASIGSARYGGRRSLPQRFNGRLSLWRMASHPRRSGRGCQGSKSSVGRSLVTSSWLVEDRQSDGYMRGKSSVRVTGTAVLRKWPHTSVPWKRFRKPSGARPVVSAAGNLRWKPWPRHSISQSGWLERGTPAILTRCCTSTPMTSSQCSRGPQRVRPPGLPRLTSVSSEHETTWSTAAGRSSPAN